MNIKSNVKTYIFDGVTPDELALFQISVDIAIEEMTKNSAKIEEMKTFEKSEDKIKQLNSNNEEFKKLKKELITLKKNLKMHKDSH